MSNKRLVMRSNKVNFMDVGQGEFARMKFFTSMGESKNASEYSRTYYDENSERVDVTGISSSIAFTMDERLGDPVHDVIVDIFENERLGSDATVKILSVNFSKPNSTDDGYEAKVREFNLIPESEGEGIDAYQYSGTLRALGSTKHGIATTTETGPTSQLEKFSFVELEETSPVE